MRWIGVFGVLCFAAVPAFGHAVLYTFHLDPNYSLSYIDVYIHGEGSAQMSLGGTFEATIYQSDGHIGPSDTFVLGPGCSIGNTEPGEIEILGGWLTATVAVGDLQLLAFDPNYPPGGIHIEEGGTFSHTSGAHVSAYAKVVVTGLFTTTVTTTVTSELVHVEGTISTSVYESDTILLNLNMVVNSIPIHLPTTTSILMDLEVHLEGTAHMTPDPALGGLVALGLGGAGTWLRRRRV